MGTAHPPRAPANDLVDAVSATDVRVRFCETDLMGIVHHANYLVYFEAARVDYLHKRGISYEAWVREGIHLPVVRTSLRYRKPARFDDHLIVEARCAELTRVTLTFAYRVTRGDDLVCEGDTLLACVGEKLDPKRIPPGIADVFRMKELAPELWAHG